jgi:acyl carrier protein
MFRDATRTRPIALVADLAEEGAAIVDADGDGGRASTLAELLEATPVDERPELAESTVRRLVGSVLKMPESRIDATTPFGSLGLDSLMAIELRNALEVEVGLKLSATMAWNYPTVVDLRDYVLMRLGAGGSAADLDDAGSDADRDGAASADVDDLAAAVAALDDDAALRALMGTEDA